MDVYYPDFYILASNPLPNNMKYRPVVITVGEQYLSFETLGFTSDPTSDTTQMNLYEIAPIL